MGSSQGEGVLDVDLGELSAELVEGVVVLDVFAQIICLIGRNPTGAVGSIAPDLEFVVGTEAGRLAVFANRSLAELFGEGSGSHLGNGGNAVKDLLAALVCGVFWVRLHGGHIMTMQIDTDKAKKMAGWKALQTFLSYTQKMFPAGKSMDGVNLP